MVRGRSSVRASAEFSIRRLCPGTEKSCLSVFDRNTLRWLIGDKLKMVVTVHFILQPFTLLGFITLAILASPDLKTSLGLLVVLDACAQQT